MTRQRLVALLTAVLLATLGGGALAVPVTLGVRSWLNDAEGASDPLVLGIGYLVWALTAGAISAWWLRRKARG
ncbi:MAG TPA: hypothetical protein VFK61_05520 [Candidatus Limnocylindria bacterium]|nr:hypothetical protein [Candidatus Limnocylindria bacterium]